MTAKKTTAMTTPGVTGRCPRKETMNNETTPAAGTCTGEPPCSTEPCRRAFSREEMIEEAKAYMRDTWGPCRESEDRDRWHERLGMLVDFIHDRFPSNAELSGQASRESEVTNVQTR